MSCKVEGIFLGRCRPPSGRLASASEVERGHYLTYHLPWPLGGVIGSEFAKTRGCGSTFALG